MSVFFKKWKPFKYQLELPFVDMSIKKWNFNFKMLFLLTYNSMKFLILKWQSFSPLSQLPAPIKCSTFSVLLSFLIHNFFHLIYYSFNLLIPLYLDHIFLKRSLSLSENRGLFPGRWNEKVFQLALDFEKIPKVEGWMYDLRIVIIDYFHVSLALLMKELVIHIIFVNLWGQNARLLANYSFPSFILNLRCITCISFWTFWTIHSLYWLRCIQKR